MKAPFYDGSIDVEHRVILSQRGVTRVDHLYLCLAAEKIGHIMTAIFSHNGSAHHPVAIYDENEEVVIPKADVSPRVKRWLGGTIMTVALSIGVLPLIEPMTHVATGVAEVATTTLTERVEDLFNNPRG